VPRRVVRRDASFARASGAAPGAGSGLVAENLGGKDGKALRIAHAEVEDQEDEHLYHTMGWARELWIESLGMPAVLPPPEEEKSVKTAIGAARAKLARDKLL
jgi:hypothetical protein